MKNYFSRLGRSFIPAVAVMSFFSIILSFGAVLRNPFIIEKLPFLGGELIQAFALILNESGLVVIENMPFIFAISIAYGMTTNPTKKGIAAFSAVIGFFFMLTFNELCLQIFNQFLTPEVIVEEGTKVAIKQTMEMKESMQNYVLGFHVVDSSVVGGIFVGATAAAVTNKYHNIRLPMAFGFYQGSHFPPILTGILCGVIGFLTPFIWPFLGGFIYGLAGVVAAMGAIGSFLFGFIERLLVPTGLHHVWYSVVHYTPVGGSVEIAGEVYEGTKAITTAALSTPGYTEDLSEVTRLWLGQGATPIKLFGIPGALLAMYHVAHNKTRAKAVCLGAACAAIFAGVTEPFEFMFLFLAPPLFLIHAVLTGLSFMILDLVNASYLGGSTIFDFIFNGILQSEKSTWQPVFVVGVIMFFAYYFIFRWYIVRFDVKTPGREELSEEVDEEYELQATKMMNQNTNRDVVAKYALEALGGKDNIIEYSNCISRLRVIVKNPDIVDFEKLQKTPDSLGCVRAGNDQFQLIFGMKVSEYADAFEEEVINGKKV